MLKGSKISVVLMEIPTRRAGKVPTIDDDNLIVFPPKADDNSWVFVYSIHEH